MSINPIPDIAELLAPPRRLRERVIAACEPAAIEDLARVDDDASDADTIGEVEPLLRHALARRGLLDAETDQ